MRYTHHFLYLSLFILLAVGFGCGRLSQIGRGNTSPSGTNVSNSTVPRNEPAKSTAPSTAGSSSPLDAVKNAFSSMRVAPSYTEKMNITREHLNNTLTLEHVSPDRFRIKREGQVGAGLGSQTSESIFIGDKGWIRRGDGPWKPMPANLKIGEMLKEIGNPDKFSDLPPGRTIEGKETGSEMVDGQQAKVYVVTNIRSTAAGNDESGDDSVSRTLKLWLNAGGLPIKFEETADFGQGSTEVINGTIDFTSTPVIEAPSQ